MLLVSRVMKHWLEPTVSALILISIQETLFGTNYVQRTMLGDEQDILPNHGSRESITSLLLPQKGHIQRLIFVLERCS